MSTITVKNIPDDLYEQLRRTATANHRSINSEIIVCIERAVQGRSITDVETILADARRLREFTKDHPITDAEFNRAKRAGRA
ncbi:MAG: Arc family DNA-binding protein [Thermoguttaceae bacterium]